jgi:hypothetical protein
LPKRTDLARRRLRTALAIVACAVPALLYKASLDNPFVFDDKITVLLNASLVDPSDVRPGLLAADRVPPRGLAGNLLTEALVIWRYVWLLVALNGQALVHQVRWVTSLFDPAGLEACR